MSLLVVGLSHRSAPVSVLERAALSSDAQVKLVQDTVAAEPAGEAAVLATCNRIELYADVDKFHAGVSELSTLLAQHSGVGLDELTPHLYVHYEDRAVHHLFSVACGLDSMVVGEGQILAQIKDSLARAQELQTAGRLLNELFQQGLRVGKRAHSETGIDRAGQSLVTFGLEQLAGRTPVPEWLHGKRALVIGAGSMSSLAAATLARGGVAEVVVANRTFDRAERLAHILTDGAETSRVHARAVSMDAVAAELTRADLVISCTGATGLVLDAEEVARAVRDRTGTPAAVPAPGSGATDDESTSDDAATGANCSAPDGCPVDLTAVRRGPNFSVMGEAAVAGMDAATLEQHGAWVAVTGPEQHDAATDRRTGPDGTDPEVITALAATAAGAGRIPERRQPEPVKTRRPEPPVLSVLDLAMPRDVDPAVHRLAGVRLVDIESLADASAAASADAQAATDGTPDGVSTDGNDGNAACSADASDGHGPATPAGGPIAADVEQVRRIVSDEVEAFGAAQRAARITPTVVALRTMAAEVVAGEMARLEGRLPGLDAKQRGEITQTVRRVVDKLLHAPTVRVKQLAAEPGGAGYADALRTLFDLDQEAVTAVSRADRKTRENEQTEEAEDVADTADGTGSEAAGKSRIDANARNRGRS